MIEKDAWYEEQKARFEKDPEYWVEEMRFAFSDEVGRMMEERGVTRAELARRLNSSPAYVTRLFHAMFNPTLLTLAKVAVALDARVALHLSPADALRTEWLDLIAPAPTAQAPVAPCWPKECGQAITPTAAAGRRDERTTAASAA
jgi:transcriptional regulator with XRE-family HTH domain